MGKPTVLIVDDEQDLVMMIKIKLESEGFRVIEAYDGEEALEKVKEKPDLILLDIMMPKMDGLQVCAKLKKDPTMQKIPIIMVTAKAQETDQQWGKECGADSYITKPYQFDALIKQIRELLGI
ncbi:MAG: hypothetical protein A2Z91_06090 [Deltaproteobacteria bacterium GWA2_38_16]|nr:MAG: hypothetical protein A2Z91_06090 [Deltaproteobacteria bacterium GWA2_38_16]OGQ03744.1 MAG: hypothetical protein A3D19_02720 [Deltaproteobacteria bacterium RIFCSPHIGHO2_02_FULL_38_15]OGQ33465.1 MAG: hypothetical protein A3A72_02490 [Deltaproteobacteria bacterium RIFCSPLOWO2_01_FULL_38_9]OGQ61966.1 MAG: hypothetical protein A3G92_06995 [Deltaproteobacteria bacterium RIFCSPLOWO2_12_FULL_38_8]HBQ21306.1 two-component system response regulator [Deltaproteobacteria bacterium]